MARRGLSRPAGEIRFQEPPSHDKWIKGRLTGSLRLSLEIPTGQFVSPSTGRLTLVSQGAEEVVAQEAARLAGTPVIPGSGIKGAVRTLYELLSFSCDPFAWADRARRTEASRCTARSCCDACSLFGVLGRSGRVGFDDARPAGPDAVRVEVQKVPVPWTPQKPEGDVSLYDFQEATVFDRDRKVSVKQLKELSREVFLGTFENRMTFWNVSVEELGRLLLSMGIGRDEATRFLLRLGGVKYDGKGAVKVQPRSLTLASPERKHFEGEPLQEQASAWLEAARTSAWAVPFWPKLEEVAKLLRGPA
ncbi:MAG TPA: RAMP superfamily CRISPR-associated protein [Thermoanaerobaculia bacterium]|nr:RAMP superfamily CRISPR-associated protein [Thermoanaerobaculia bacterium]